MLNLYNDQAINIMEKEILINLLLLHYVDHFMCILLAQA